MERWPPAACRAGPVHLPHRDADVVGLDVDAVHRQGVRDQHVAATRRIRPMDPQHRLRRIEIHPPMRHQTPLVQLGPHRPIQQDGSLAPARSARQGRRAPWHSSPSDPAPGRRSGRRPSRTEPPRFSFPSFYFRGLEFRVYAVFRLKATLRPPPHLPRRDYPPAGRPKQPQSCKTPPIRAGAARDGCRPILASLFQRPFRAESTITLFSESTCRSLRRRQTGSVSPVRLTSNSTPSPSRSQETYSEFATIQN